MKPIRVGIVGANPQRGWARDAHLSALRALPVFAITAVSARTQAGAEAAATHFGAARAFGDSLALARDPDVDVVAVTVKVPEHRAVVLAALAAGKHVYCEWPLGRDLAEAQEMAAAVPAGVHAMVGLQGLFAPAVRAARDLVARGALGRLKVMRVFGSAAAWGAQTDAASAYLQDRRNGATLETIGGGHTLATAEALAGPWREVDARCTTFLPEVPVSDTGGTVPRTSADHMLVLGRHDSGCVSTFEVVGGRPADRTALFELAGEDGWLRLSGTVPGTCQIAPLRLEASAPVALPDPVAPHLSGPAVNVAEAWAAFAADLRTGQRTVPDFGDAVRLARLLAAIDTASRDGRRQVPA
ncbi:MAG: Gfo/Idh/MocA family oxidoreductase [Sphingomonadales bacterium]|nr:Gfo/Idh/MocA family oxidoreductase [Sphingomonadales bacterium]